MTSEPATEQNRPPDATARRIDLRLPASPEVLQLVRLSATFVASQADLALEDIADLMLAIDELCSSVLGPDPAPQASLLVDYRWDMDSVDVSCRLAGAHPPPEARVGDGSAVVLPESADLGSDAREWASFLSRLILGALVDEHALVVGEQGWLRKHRVGALR